MPYPTNICVNTGASVAGPEYGIYSCNDAGDTVTHTSYQRDSLCQDETIASTQTIYTNDGLSSGDLFSFKCNGVNSYLGAKSSVNDPTCSTTSVVTKVAIDVCYRLPSGESAMYVIQIVRFGIIYKINTCTIRRITCSGTEALQYSYSHSDGCSDENIYDEPDYHLFSDECVLFADYLGVIQIYTLMHECFDTELGLISNEENIFEPPIVEYSSK